MINESNEKKCCCGCCSVRDGTITISIFYIVATLYDSYKTIECIYLILRDPQDLVTHILHQNQYLYSSGRKELKDFILNHSTAVLIYYCIDLVVNTINLIFSWLLLYGASKKKKSKCLPWLYFNVLLTVLGFITTLLIYLSQPRFMSPNMFLMFLFIVYWIQISILRVVNDYTEELRLSSGERPSAGRIYFSSAIDAPV